MTIFTIPGTDIRIHIADELLQDLVDWAVMGAPDPSPDIIKKMTVVQYAKAFGVASFVETGTFRGSTTRLMADYGLDCKSVELSDQLYAEAARQLGHYPNIELFHGDSGTLLRTMAGRARAPHLFWLDGHYSAGDTARGDVDTPILRELEQLLAHDLSQSVILVDDVRAFGEGDYPPIADVIAFAAAHWPNHVCEIAGDILRITPRTTLSGRLAVTPPAQAA